MPHILWWPMTSEVDISGMAVEVEPSCQYSVTFSVCLLKRYVTWKCM